MPDPTPWVPRREMRKNEVLAKIKWYIVSSDRLLKSHTLGTLCPIFRHADH